MRERTDASEYSTWNKKSRAGNRQTETIQKRKPATKEKSTTTLTNLSNAEIKLLGICKDLTADTVARQEFQSVLQQVKASLYARKYEEAFSTSQRLQAYFARWVPARALIYRRLFLEKIGPHLSFDGPLSFVCFGAGPGSELLALASLALSLPSADYQLTQLDVVDWSTATQGILPAINTPNLTLNDLVIDALGDQEVLSEALSKALVEGRKVPCIFTILFTISELFIQSRAKTITLLSLLSSTAIKGDLLLIVESAELSSIPVGKDGRLYPLGFLLDHSLGMADDQKGGWEVLESTDSEWFRLDAKAADLYPLKLENSRVLVRLFRKM